MFSKGQLIFAVLFLIAFIFFIVRAYKKDSNLHKRNFKGVGWIGLAFFTFIIILFVIKYILKN